MLTLLPCCVSASAPSHSTGPHRSHRTGSYQLYKQQRKMIQHFYCHYMFMAAWRGVGGYCRNFQRNYWKAKPVSLLQEPWLKSLPLARGPKPARCRGSGWWGGTCCCRQGVTVVHCFLLVPGIGAVTHAGTAPMPLMLLICLSPSCSLAVLQCKSYWQGFKQGNFVCRGSNRAPCNALILFYMRWGFCLRVFGSLSFGCLLGFFGFGPFFIVWFGLGYSLQSTHKCLSAVVLHGYTRQVPRERLMKIPVLPRRTLLNCFPH